MVTLDAPVPDTGTPAWRRVRWSGKLTAGLLIVGVFAVVATLGPLFVGDPDRVSGARLVAPSAEHPLGTTDTGQDVLDLLIVSTRGSVTIGLVVGVLATIVSVLVGVLGGYLGGPADESLSVLSNVTLVIPTLPLVILITDYVESRAAVTVAAIIAITWWAGSARVLRAQTLSLRNREYVNAARVAGEPAYRIIGFEILPNLLPIVAAQFVTTVIGGVLTETALAFLGLGGDRSWGTMLYFAQNAQALALGAWWWFIPPGLCTALLAAGLALVNFSIDEVVNPRLRVDRATRRALTARGAA